MSGRENVVLELSRLEAGHLADLVGQFLELVDDGAARELGSQADPAIVRLVPDAYPDDRRAGREFRELTADALLQRRADDARVVLATIGAGTTTDAAAADALEPHVVRLDAETIDAWLRTLAALRLVLASRLGIEDESDHREGDPRFGVYDWLGYRLAGLVDAAG